MSLLILLGCAELTPPPARPLLLPSVIDGRTLLIGQDRMAVFADAEGRALTFRDGGSTWAIRLPDGGAITATRVTSAKDGDVPAWDLSGPAKGLSGACAEATGAALRVEDLGMGRIRATWCGQSALLYAGSVSRADQPADPAEDYRAALRCLEEQDSGLCSGVEHEVLRARGSNPRNWAVGAGPVFELPCDEGVVSTPRAVEVQVSSGSTVALVEQHSEMLGLMTTQLSACAEEHWRREPCLDEPTRHRLDDPAERGDALRACYDEVLSLLAAPELRAQLELRVEATPAPR